MKNLAHKLFDAIACCAIAGALAACSGQSAIAPSGSTIRTQQSSGTLSPATTQGNPLNRETLSQVMESYRAQDAALAQRGALAKGCTPIPAGAFRGLTAAVVLNGTRTVDVNGMGCDVALYIPPGAIADIRNITVGNAVFAAIGVDVTARLSMTKTNVNGGKAVDGISSFGDLTMDRSTVLHDGRRAAVDVEAGGARITNSTMYFGLAQAGVNVSSSTEVDKSSILYSRGTTTGDFEIPTGVEVAGPVQLNFETIRVSDGGVGIFFLPFSIGTVSKTTISGDGALYGIRFVNQSGPITVKDSTLRMTGAASGVLASCQFRDPIFGCGPFTISGTTAVGDGNPKSIGFGFYNRGFTLQQNTSRKNGTGYVTYCVPGFTTLSDLTTFLAANGNVARSSTLADAAVVTNRAQCTPPFP